MDLLIAALALGTLALGAYVAARRTHRRSGAGIPVAVQATDDQSLEQIRPGDVVLDGASTMIAREVRLCRDGSAEWHEVRLDEDGHPRWLVVDRRQQDTVLLGQQIACPAILGAPSRQLDHDGRVYQLERRGCAQCRTTETPPDESAQQLHYWDYRGVGDYRVWLRRNADGYSCFAGQLIPRHRLELLPCGHPPCPATT